MTQSLISHTGDPLAVDDTIQVVFTVTIDPDAAGTSSSGLENEATSTGTGINPDTGLADPTLPAMDISDNGTDPTAENGEDDGDGVFGNDPTPIVIADISVVKAVSDTPTPLANGNFEVVYSLVIENNGNVDLADLTLVEDLASQFGLALVSAGDIALATPPSAASTIVLESGWDGDASTEMISQAAATLLAVGDSFTVEFTVEVDPDAVANPDQLDNQVIVGGNAVDESGVAIADSTGAPITTTDDSDSGADPNGTNPNDQGDMGTSDDPTPLLIPDVAVAKSAGAAVADGDNFDVTFTLIYENTGTVTLQDLSLTDDIMSQFGNAFVTTTGATVQNLIGSGTLPTANSSWAGDTTANMLVGGSLDVNSSFEVVFTVTIDPDGIDSVSQGLNNQAVAEGVGVNPDGTPMVDSAGNPVTATDDSDNGANPTGENGAEDTVDGIAENDPTPILIADLGLAKSVVGTPVLLSNGNFNVTYQLIVENTGTVDLANLSLIEDLDAQFGAGLISAVNLSITVPPAGLDSTVTLDSGWDGSGVTELVDGSAASLLEIGDSFTLEFVVEVEVAALSPSPTTNSVTATADGVDANGEPFDNPLVAMDDSDSGTDASGTNNGEPGDSFGSDDPTPLYIPSIGLAKSAGDAVANGDNFDVTFTLVFENNGSVDLTNLTLFDDIAAQFGDAFVSVDDVAVQNFVGSGTAPTVNGAWTGGTSQTIIAGGTANVGDSFEVVFTATIDPDAAVNAGSLNNQATANGEALDSNGNPLTDGAGNPVTATDVSDDGTSATDENGEEVIGDGVFANDPTPVQIADLGIAKSLIGEPILTEIGNYVVTFQVVVENTGTLDLGSLSLLEDISAQFGSAFVDAGNLTLVTSPSDPDSSISTRLGWLQR